MRLWTAVHSTPGLEQAALIAELQGYGPPMATLAQAQVAAQLPEVWRLGYGPTDLLHLLARARSASHVHIAAAAVLQDHHARGGPGGPAWDTQVSQIRHEVTAAPTTIATLPAAVDLLSLLLRLGPIPSAMPIGRPEAAATTGMDGQVLARVRALLRKAESTEFDAEADALTAKAQQLITRYAIDEARLHATDPTTATAAARRILLHDPYIDAKAMLVHVVARANRAHAVNSREAGWCTVFGTDADLDATELLIASLQAQAVGAMARLGPQRDAHGRSRTRSFRNAFLQGFAVRIGDRLDQANDDVLNHEADRDLLLPVLASHGDRAKAAAHAAFPRLVDGRVGAISNGAGWFAGMSAADLASLDITAGALTPAS